MQPENFEQMLKEETQKYIEEKERMNQAPRRDTSWFRPAILKGHGIFSNSILGSLVALAIEYARSAMRSPL